MSILGLNYSERSPPPTQGDDAEADCVCLLHIFYNFYYLFKILRYCHTGELEEILAMSVGLIDVVFVIFCIFILLPDSSELITCFSAIINPPGNC